MMSYGVIVLMIIISWLVVQVMVAMVYKQARSKIYAHIYTSAHKCMHTHTYSTAYFGKIANEMATIVGCLCQDIEKERLHIKVESFVL